MTDVADDPLFRRDSELYRVISRARFRPVMWTVTEAEAVELRKHFAKMFPNLPSPMLRVRFEQSTSDAEADKHAPLFRAIRPSN